ncbi:MAG TPA: DNA repair protein RecN [Bacteroides sp.]|nr:DNA repair protein RecN [Bacteroides sp.]
MIRSIYIKNYLLIDELEIRFRDGFTTITGETGAGKSILMGALSLILGQRADTSLLKLKDAKCIVEGEFALEEPDRPLFEEHELDFEPVTTIRREISPAGKSRAFVNDSPVNLPLLKELGQRLVDIHSQHQNLQLHDHLYQMEVIDYLAGTKTDLAGYRSVYTAYLDVSRDLDQVRNEIARMKEDLDYMQFQYNELASAHLKSGEMEILETDLQHAEHAEEIRTSLNLTAQLFNAEGSGVLDQLREALLQLGRISGYFNPAGVLATRVESAYIELKDLFSELESHAEKARMEPGKLEQLRERIDLLYGLMQKHRVKHLEELISLRDRLEEKINDLTFSDEKIGKLEKERAVLLAEMESRSQALHGKRMKAGGEMQEQVQEQLRQLGIPNARFSVDVIQKEAYDMYGRDEVRFLFSANKQMALEEISRVASGGEVSRLMLCIKSLVSDRKGMPTLIFDEIDAGVSGEIADKVGGIMDHLASGRQVIAITHLPQVASRGAEHFVVFKEDTSEATYTRIRKLDQAERITEIAKMLSGEKVTEAALSNARVLLGV